MPIKVPSSSPKIRRLASMGSNDRWEEQFAPPRKLILFIQHDIP